MTSAQIEEIASAHAIEAFKGTEEEFRTVYSTLDLLPDESLISALGCDAVSKLLGIKDWDKRHKHLAVYNRAYIAQWDSLCSD